MIESPLLLAALVAGVTALAFWLDRSVPALSKVGASLLAIAMGATLSNAGLVPASSPVYDAVAGPVTSLAIAWLLLAVRLSDVRQAGKGMLGAFGIAVLGTAAGAATGAFLFAARLGEETWKLAGTLTGTYSGGSVNFVAVGRGVGMSESLFVGATAADNVVTALWLGACLMLPLWLARFYPTPIPEALDGEEEVEHPFFAAVPMSTLDLALLLAAGFGLVVAADATAALVPGIPAVLWLTTFALLAAQIPRLQAPPGAMQLGNLALHAFFVIIGIYSRVSEILAVGVHVFFYALLVVAVHGVVVFGGGRLLRLDVATLSVASQAAVGGPSSALAVAVSRDWRALVLPGILVGLVGYALGNYAGFAVAYLVRGMGLGL